MIKIIKRDKSWILDSYIAFYSLLGVKQNLVQPHMRFLDSRLELASGKNTYMLQVRKFNAPLEQLDQTSRKIIFPSLSIRSNSRSMLCLNCPNIFENFKVLSQNLVVVVLDLHVRGMLKIWHLSIVWGYLDVA